MNITHWHIITLFALSGVCVIVLVRALFYLNKLFKKYFKKLSLPNVMAKKNFHELVSYLPRNKIDPEIKDKLEAIGRVAQQARPVEKIND